MNGWRNQVFVYVDFGIGGLFEIFVMISNYFLVLVFLRKSRLNSFIFFLFMEVYDLVLEDYGEKREIEIRSGRFQSFLVDFYRLSYLLLFQLLFESEFDENGCRQRGSSFNEDVRFGMKG